MLKQAIIFMIMKSSCFHIEDTSNIILFFYDKTVNIITKTWNYYVTGHHLFHLNGKEKQSPHLFPRTLHEVRFIRIKQSAIAPRFNTSLTTMKRADVHTIYWRHINYTTTAVSLWDRNLGDTPECEFQWSIPTVVVWGAAWGGGVMNLNIWNHNQNISTIYFFICINIVSLPRTIILRIPLHLVLSTYQIYSHDPKKKWYLWLSTNIKVKVKYIYVKHVKNRY